MLVQWAGRRDPGIRLIDITFFCAARATYRISAPSRMDTELLCPIRSDSASSRGCMICGNGMVARQAVPSRRTRGVSVKNLPSQSA